MNVKERIVVGSVTAAFMAIGVLGFLIDRTGEADCHRTQALVVGIHTILDRSSERAQQYVKEGVITQKQADEGVEENRRLRRYITLPKC